MFNHDSALGYLVVVLNDHLLPPAFFFSPAVRSIGLMNNYSLELMWNALVERERDAEIDGLKALLSLKEAEVAEAIRLRGQVATFEAAKAARMYCDDLSIKAASFESEKDKLIDQVSTLEGTCSGLRDEVSGYKLFKEQIEVVQDEHVKMLSDKVAGIVHLDEEFYPSFLTTLDEGAIGRAIDKGMRDGLAAGIYHGKSRRGLAEVAAYNPAAEANFLL
ncbi:hypothetical protein Tco_0353178 [Tanacetum coccineum]